FIRMRGHPVANALDRHLAARDEIAFDEHALDRAVAITVVRIIAHPQRRAVLEDHARGAFDLDHQQIEWILQPADFEFLPIERAGLDRGAIVVGHELVVLVAAADAHAFIWKCNRGYLEMQPRLVCSRRRGDHAAGGRAGHGIRGWESASPLRRARNNRSTILRARPAARCEPVENSSPRWPGRYSHPSAPALWHSA